jgi:hypothetical protein
LPKQTIWTKSRLKGPSFKNLTFCPNLSGSVCGVVVAAAAVAAAVSATAAAAAAAAASVVGELERASFLLPSSRLP